MLAFSPEYMLLIQKLAHLKIKLLNWSCTNNYHPSHTHRSFKIETRNSKSISFSAGSAANLLLLLVGYCTVRSLP